jgi:hypothetical protein
MTIGVHLNQQKVPFAKFMKSFKGMNAYDDESKIEQVLISKGFTRMIPVKGK